MASAAASASASASASAAATIPPVPSSSRQTEEEGAIRALTLTHDAHMFLRARNVLLEVLEMRGFDVSPIAAESPEELETMTANLLQYYMTVYQEGDRSRTGRKCRVFLAKTPAKAMNATMNHLNEAHPEPLVPNQDEVLFVIFGPLSPAAIRSVTAWSRSNQVQADAVQVQSLLFNPFRHMLVPEYEPVPVGSDMEEEILRAAMVQKKRHLPVIQSSDIIARLLGLRREQLVIVRNKGPGGSHTFVRVCLDG